MLVNPSTHMETLAAINHITNMIMVGALDRRLIEQQSAPREHSVMRIMKVGDVTTIICHTTFCTMVTLNDPHVSPK